MLLELKPPYGLGFPTILWGGEIEDKYHTESPELLHLLLFIKVNLVSLPH